MKLYTMKKMPRPMYAASFSVVWTSCDGSQRRQLYVNLPAALNWYNRLTVDEKRVIMKDAASREHVVMSSRGVDNIDILGLRYMLAGELA